MGRLAHTARRAAVCATSILACSGIGVGIATAADPIEAEPVGVYTGAFTQLQYQADQGEVPQFNNPVGAEALHDVTATRRGPGGGPLFRSATIGAGKTTPVLGTQFLAAGTYDFYCSVHAATMKSKLMISDAGTPEARPRIDVTIPAQTLSRVRTSGKLKVRVRALTKSSGISLLAEKGGKRLASKSGLSLGAGVSRTVSLVLTGSGRRKLKGIDSALVSAKGSVPFGPSDSAQFKLR